MPKQSNLTSRVLDGPLLGVARESDASMPPDELGGIAEPHGIYRERGKEVTRLLAFDHRD